VPYRATRKSWTLEGHGATRPMIDAFLESAAELGDQDLDISRLGLQLDDAGHAELVRRMDDVLQDFAAREPDRGGRPCGRCSSRSTRTRIGTDSGESTPKK